MNELRVNVWLVAAAVEQVPGRNQPQGAGTVPEWNWPQWTGFLNPVDNLYAICTSQQTQKRLCASVFTTEKTTISWARDLLASAGQGPPGPRDLLASGGQGPPGPQDF